MCHSVVQEDIKIDTKYYQSSNEAFEFANGLLVLLLLMASLLVHILLNFLLMNGWLILLMFGLLLLLILGLLVLVLLGLLLNVLLLKIIVFYIIEFSTKLLAPPCVLGTSLLVIP